jgi:NADPH:quinone reductase-like Zn-dependent oxidoreductase
LHVEEIDTPVVAGNEVLVRVHAAAVHPGDYFVITGVPYVLRLAFGVRRPRHAVPGRDVAGHIEAVGKNVTRLEPGDEVFGWSTAGTLAEYTCAPEDNFARGPPTSRWSRLRPYPYPGSRRSRRSGTSAMAIIVFIRHLASSPLAAGGHGPGWGRAR